MRNLTFAMNVTLDGYVAAPGDDLGWSVPSDELFQWWSDRVGATSLALYGRRRWGDDELPLADRRSTARRLVQTRTFPDGVVLTRFTQLSRAVKNGVPPPTRTGALTRYETRR